jgi:hypothetical protein
MSIGFHGNTCSCGIGYLFSLDTALVCRAQIILASVSEPEFLFHS